jgi:hypothetical protein
MAKKSGNSSQRSTSRSVKMTLLSHDGLVTTSNSNMRRVWRDRLAMASERRQQPGSCHFTLIVFYTDFQCIALSNSACELLADAAHEAGMDIDLSYMDDQSRQNFDSSARIFEDGSEDEDEWEDIHRSFEEASDCGRAVDQSRSDLVHMCVSNAAYSPRHLMHNLQCYFN